MNHHDKRSCTTTNQVGFTLIELMFVIALIAVLSYMAVPPLMQLRANAEYREATRDIVSVMRNARTRAIADNLQHRVEFDPAVPCKRYQLTRGNRAYNTDTAAGFTTSIQGWTSTPTSVTLVTTDHNIVFNPNGTATFTVPADASETVKIEDSTGKMHFTVQVFPTGRITVQ